MSWGRGNIDNYTFANERAKELRGSEISIANNIKYFIDSYNRDAKRVTHNQGYHDMVNILMTNLCIELINEH